MNANFVLGKSLGTLKEKKEVTKEIKWNKWQDISKDKDANSFSLFS